MNTKVSFQLNTLDHALARARVLSRDLASGEVKAALGYRIFSALAANEREGLVAFLIWRIRAEMLKELNETRP